MFARLDVQKRLENVQTIRIIEILPEKINSFSFFLRSDPEPQTGLPLGMPLGGRYKTLLNY